MPLLTKSRFKLAVECPTKIYFASHRAEYHNNLDDNDFLKSLADGGHQVGELAKYKYHPDPVSGAITVETLDQKNALAQTEHRLAEGGRIVIAEAAVQHQGYFIRVDILIRDDATKVVEVIEVKSKSLKKEDLNAGFKNAQGEYATSWRPYLVDIAFQTRVVELAMPGYRVVPKLVLVDSDYESSIDGLHQMFAIVRDAEKQKSVKVRRASTASLSDIRAATEALHEVNLEGIVRDLVSRPLVSEQIPPQHNASFEQFMRWAEALQAEDRRYFARPGKACKGCQFSGSNGARRDGRKECWAHALEQGWLRTESGRLEADPLATELWGGGAGNRSVVGEAIASGAAFVRDIPLLGDLPDESDTSNDGFTPAHRRSLQVAMATGQRSRYRVHHDYLRIMDTWEWPLHMIDFETSAPALPFFKGMSPYEVIAFQFSYHRMDRDAEGRIHISHAGQFIDVNASSFPSYEFVRALKNYLMPNGQLVGTVFRYHHHENTVLRAIGSKLLAAQESAPSDAQALITFIDRITKSGSGKDARVGDKCMVDLHEIVRKGYYSKHAGGSISIKAMLPAILADAPEFAQKYRQPGVYGRGLPIPSLNFGPEGHVWLRADKGNDPYKTLPPVFGEGFEDLDDILFRFEQISDETAEQDGVAIDQGGLAMMAYNYTQFAHLSENARHRIRKALLKYCELDTLAMVMLVEGLLELRVKRQKMSF